jgi:hypothetical protein
MIKTYYSEFYPDPSAGVEGSTVPSITKERVEDLVGTALENLDIALDDSVLSKDEKIRILIPFDNQIEIEYTTVRGNAVAQAVSVTTLDSARDSWQTYRNSLTPAWNDTNESTTINRVNFRAAINGYVAAINATREATVAQAATTADIATGLTNDGNVVLPSDIITSEGTALTVIDGGITQNKIAESAIVPAHLSDATIEARHMSQEALNATAYASSITPVAGYNNLAAFPTLTADDAGRLAFNKENKKLYRWTGTAWTANAETADLIGTIVAEQIENGVISAEKLISGSRFVETVSALPTTGNVEGRVVVFSGKIYRYTNGAFTTATDTIDLNGTIISEQIADAALTTAKFASNIRPVEIFSSLPTTGNVEGRVVNVAGKLYRYVNGAFTSSTAVTDLTGQISQSQIADEAITAAKFAAGTKPVRVISAAEVNTATAPNPVDMEVLFNQGDGKMYRGYNGTWIPIFTDTADLLGTIKSAQIFNGAVSLDKFATNLRPVENVGALPAAGTVGRVVFYNGELWRDNGTAFVRDVPAAAVTGTMTAAQIGNNILDHTKVAPYYNLPRTVFVNPGQMNNGATVAPFAGAIVYNSHEGIMYRNADGNNLATAWQPLIQPAGQISGQLTSTQISSIVASQISDTLAATQIPGLDVSKIVSGQFGAARIIDGAITQAKMQLGLDIPRSVNIDPAQIQTIPYIASASGVNLLHNVADGKMYRNYGQGWGTLVVGAGDLAGAITETQITNSAISTPKLNVNDLYANNVGVNIIQAGTLDASKIVAGSIQAGQIAAGAIIASKIVISDPENLVLDADVTDPSYWTEMAVSSMEGVIFHNSNNLGNYSAWGSRGIVQVDPGRERYICSPRIKVTAGETLYAAGRMYSGGGSAELFLRYEDVAGGAVYYESFGQNTNPWWDVYSGTMTVPAERAYVRFMFCARGVNAGLTQFGKPVLRRRVGAELIVNGAILAEKIAVDAVIASKIAANAVVADKIAANAITAVKILAGAIGTDKLAANAVEADKIAANAITSVKIMAGAITTDKILAGTITAANIGAGQITASKMIVTDLTNLVPDADLKDRDNWTHSQAGSASFGDSGGELGNVAVLYAPAGQYSFLHSREFPVTVGDKLFLKISGRVADGTTGSGHMNLQYFNQAGGLYLEDGFIGFGVSGDVQTSSGTVTVPSGAVRARVRFYKEAAGNATTAHFVKPVVRRMNGAELIVDGAIIAAKLAVGAVEADKIAANAITSVKILANAITGEKILAGSVDANRITAGTIQAAQIAAGVITASKMAIGFDNLILNNEFRNNSLDGWSRIQNSVGAISAAGPVTNTSSGWPTPYSMTIARGGNNSVEQSVVAHASSWDDGLTHGIDTELGDEFVFDAVVWGSNAGQFVGADLLWRSGMDTGLSQFTVVSANQIPVNQSTTAVYAPGPAIVPWTVTFKNAIGRGKMWLRLWNSGNTDGYVHFWKPTLRRKNAGKLIVDGSIAANHILADAITSDKIQANAITSGKILAGAIVAGHISAGTITASHLAAHTITADKVSIGLQKPQMTYMVFTTDKNNHTVSWTAGHMLYRDSNGTTQNPFVAAGSYYWPYGNPLFIYWHVNNPGILQVSGDQTAIGNDPALTVVAEYHSGSDVRVRTGATIIDGNRIITGTITADQIAADAITADEIAAGTITANEIAADTITAAQIAAGAISAAEISAGAITASKLFIAPANMNADPQFNDSGYWTLETGVVIETRSLGNFSEALGVGRSLAFLGGNIGAGRTHAYSKMVKGTIAGGQKLRLRYKALSNSISQLGYVAVNFYNSVTGAYIDGYNLNFGANFNGNKEGIMTVPVGADAYMIYVFNDGHPTIDFTGDFVIGDIQLQQAADASLIVDGAIVASKIQANAITATHILAGTITSAQIAADTITAANIATGAITAAEIAAGAIVASKVTITDTENLILDSEILDPAAWIELDNGAGLEGVSFPNTLDLAVMSSWGSRGIVHVDPGRSRFVLSKRFKAQAGETFFASARMYSGGGTAQAFIRWEDVNGGSVVFHQFGGDAPEHSWNTQSGTVTAPVSTSYGRIAFVARPWNTGVVQFGKPIVRKRFGGELVVDGTISAGKLMAKSITAGQIAAGAITASEIAADTITAGNIAAFAITASELAAGAVIADKVAAGAISADKLAIGVGKNLLVGTEGVGDPNENWYFAYNGEGGTAAPFGMARAGAGAPWTLPDNSTVTLHQPDNWQAGSGILQYWIYRQRRTSAAMPDYTDLISIEPGKWYEASSYMGTHRCAANMNVMWMDGAGGYLGEWNTTSAVNSYGGSTLSQYTRVWGKEQAPSNARFAIIRLRKSYTDFGQADSWLMFTQPFFGETVANATGPQPYSAPGTTFITGGRIVTNAIVADHISANAITSGKINAGAVTADKITVSSLSAIAANIGDITAGLLRTSDYNTYFDLTNQRMQFGRDGYVLRQGLGIGAGVVFWYGLGSIPVGSETRYNGIFALGTDGRTYLGDKDLSLASNPLTANVNARFVTAVGSPGTTVYTGYATASVVNTNGATATYSWSQIGGGSGISIDNGSNANARFYGVVGGDEKQASFVCTISLSDGRTIQSPSVGALILNNL